MHKILAAIHLSMSITYLTLAAALLPVEHSCWAYYLVSVFDLLVAVTYTVGERRKPSGADAPLASEE